MPTESTDMLRKPLRRYNQESSAFGYPLDKLDTHVSDLMQILLSDSTEREMASRIRAICDE